VPRQRPKLTLFTTPAAISCRCGMTSIWDRMWPKRQPPVRARRSTGDQPSSGTRRRRRSSRAGRAQRASGPPIFWDNVFPMPRPGTFAPRQEPRSRSRRAVRSEQARRFYEELLRKRVWSTSELVELGAELGISRNYVYVLINRAKRMGLVRQPRRGQVVVVGHGRFEVGGDEAVERIRGIEGDIARGAAYTGYVAYRAAREAWRRRDEIAGTARRAAAAARRVGGTLRRVTRAVKEGIRDRAEKYSRSEEYYVGGRGEAEG